MPQNEQQRTSNNFQFDQMEENELKPLVTFENNRIKFDESVARETFANQRFRDKKITLVSVMGPSRSGKSFLMSILTGGRQENTVRGAFKTGYERCTEGILVFTQPMITEDGNHVVFFLDTQGTFDLQTERNISSWFACFSLLISDIQLVNLKGNIGGDNLHDLHLFIETAGACPKTELAKSLTFVIRDAPNWKENGFLENLWTECQKSRDLKEISESLQKRFENGIDCFCCASASDGIQQATGTIELTDQDENFIGSLERVVHFVHENAHQCYRSHFDYSEVAKQIIHYLENEAPRLEPTVKVTKEASIAYAMNKAFDVFQKALKGTTSKNIEAAEKSGRNSSEEKLKELLKEANVGEARKLLEPKIQALLGEKQKEFEILQEEKAFLERVEAFAKKWRAEIPKIHDLDKVRLLKQSSSIRSEGVSSSVPDPMIKSLEDMLDKRITALRSSHIEKSLSKLKAEFSQQLRETKFDSLPSLEDGHEKVKLMVEKLRETLGSQELTEKEWGLLKEKCHTEFMEIFTRSLDFIEKDLALRLKKAEFEAEVAAEIQKSESGFYSDTASDSENAQEEEHQKFHNVVECGPLSINGNNSWKCFSFPKLPSISCDSDEEKRKREAAEKTNDLSPMFLMLKQMNDQMQQQLENAREEQRRKEMKEAQKEANRREKDENEMRIRIEQRRADNERDERNRAEDRKERADERIRKEENDRRIESRKRQEKAEAEQKEKEERERAKKNKGFIRKAWAWIY